MTFSLGDRAGARSGSDDVVVTWDGFEVRDDPCPHWAEAKRHPPHVTKRARAWWARLWGRP